MHYLPFVLCMLCLLTLCEGAGRRCDIPTGKQYHVSRYRPLYSSYPRKYRPGQSVSHGMKIAITCINDIYGDAIHRQYSSRCLNGRWSPALPDCGAKNRCHAPELIADAESSRPLDHHVTFQHGTTITFTCNPGTLSTGNGDTQCQDGSWTPVTLHCEDKRKCQIPTDVQYEDAIFRSKERSRRTYDLEESVNEGTEIVVICNNEKHPSVCENGKWVPDIPSCIRERETTPVTKQPTFSPETTHKQSTTMPKTKKPITSESNPTTPIPDEPTTSKSVRTTSVPDVRTTSKSVRTTSVPVVSTTSKSVRTTSVPDVRTTSKSVRTTSIPDEPKTSKSVRTTSVPDVSTTSKSVRTTAVSDVPNTSKSVRTTAVPDVPKTSKSVRTTSVSDVPKTSKSVRTTLVPGVPKTSKSVRTTSVPDVRTTSKSVRTTSLPDVPKTSKSVRTTAVPDMRTTSKTVRTTSVPDIRTTSKSVRTTSIPDVRTTSKSVRTTSVPVVSTTSKPVRTTSVPDVSTTSKSVRTTSAPCVSTTAKPRITTLVPDEPTTPSRPATTTEKPDQPEIKCAIPPRFPNARHQSLQGKTRFEIGTIIRYVCKPGYSLAISFAVCTCDEEHDSFWVGPNMTCLTNEPADSYKCHIPTGQHYADATYRPLYSSHPRQYQAGQTVDHKKRIVVTCKNDVYVDAVHRVHKSRCFKGEWSPGLPSCHIKGRCRAPHAIHNAKPSRPLDQYVTFPHGEVITFTCKHGMHPIGNDTTVCENGKWTHMEFRCAGM